MRRNFPPVGPHSANTALHPHGGYRAAGPGGWRQHRGQGAPSLGPRLAAGEVAAQPCYNGAADPLAFLLAYEEAVLKAGGDDRIMAN